MFLPTAGFSTSSEKPSEEANSTLSQRLHHGDILQFPVNNSSSSGEIVEPLVCKIETYPRGGMKETCSAKNVSAEHSHLKENVYAIVTYKGAPLVKTKKLCYGYQEGRAKTIRNRKRKRRYLAENKSNWLNRIMDGLAMIMWKIIHYLGTGCLSEVREILPLGSFT